MGGKAVFLDYQGQRWQLKALAEHLGLRPQTLAERGRKGFPLDVDQRARRKRKGGLGPDGQRASHHPLYSTWKSMRTRCYDPDTHNFKNYGGRGITVCDAWQDFWTFVQDMGPKPSPVHSLDRIDPNGHYGPGNCRWATRGEQRLTQRKARIKREPTIADKARARIAAMTDDEVTALWSRLQQVGNDEQEIAS
jgi:hypothetical protein